VFHLRLSHGEGEPLRAVIEVPQETHPHGPWAWVAYARPCGEILPLCQGRLQETPDQLSPGCMTLALTAEGPQPHPSLKDLQQTHVSDPSFEPLLDDRRGKSEDIVRSKPVQFYIDPKTHEVRLSDLFQGTRTVNLTPFFWRDSLKVSLRTPPPRGVKVTLSAQWIQKTSGFMSLSSRIASLFPQGVINTFTGPSFKAHWPRTGQHLDQSGYWVAYSHLKAVPAPDPRQAVSRPFLCPSPVSPQPTRAKRSWFQGKLIIAWERRQKRLETLSFVLNHRVRSPFIPDGCASVQVASEDSLPELTLGLGPLISEEEIPPWTPYETFTPGMTIQDQGRLYTCIAPHQAREDFAIDRPFWQDAGPCPEPLPDPGAASFFLTPRGDPLVRHALQIAQTFLATHARCLQVQVSYPFDACPTLSLEDSVCLEDPRLPGLLTGKVVHLETVVSGEGRPPTTSVTLAVSLGDGMARPPAPLPYGHQTPQDIFAQDPQSLAHAALASLSLINGPDLQEDTLQADSQKGLRPSLMDHQTQIRLRLQRLQTREALHHHIPVTISELWSAPRQIAFARISPDRDRPG
jgi:hypothetical protein